MKEAKNLLINQIRIFRKAGIPLADWRHVGNTYRKSFPDKIDPIEFVNKLAKERHDDAEQLNKEIEEKRRQKK